jgi:hypothetical protein
MEVSGQIHAPAALYVVAEEIRSTNLGNKDRLNLNKVIWNVKDKFKSRDSSVGIALGYGLDDRDSRVQLPANAWSYISTPPIGLQGMVLS